ncbi:MAG: DUF881 domain-containing protein [Streptosporangiales bacterium]|nr:DUF881 domain-containing protein [Streptosporangiales bacterium]
MAAMSKQPGAPGGPPRPWKRPDASMSLLADLMTSDALDPGYTTAARRGEGGNGRTSSRSGAVLVLVTVVAIGLLLATAVAKVRREEPVAERHRQELVAEIESQTRQTDRLQRELVRQRRETARHRAALLAQSAAGQRTQHELSRLAFVAGETPVEGPGIQVTVDDAPERSEQESDDVISGARVLDRDLQELVNSLWAAGADAIAINGQRLTSVTAIRAAGDAILVDYRPVNPPYVVTAIGDPDTMETRFADSRAGRLFRTLESTFGIGFGVRRDEGLKLPGASALTLHYAREVRQR